MKKKGKNKNIDSFFEEFKIEYKYSFDTIEDAIEDIRNNNDYQKAVDELYLALNRIRGFSELLSLKSAKSMLLAAEDAVLMLRHKTPPINQNILDWLYMIADQLRGWLIQLDNNDFNLESLDSLSINMLKISTVSNERTDNILKKLSLLVVDPQKESLSKIGEFLEDRVNEVFLARYHQNVLKALDKLRPDILITEINLQDADPIEFIRAIKKRYVNIPIIAISQSDVDERIAKQLTINCISGFFYKPIDFEDFRRKLTEIAFMYFGNKAIRILNEDILTFIDTLKPLNQTVLEVRKISARGDSSTKEMANTINKDPLLVAQVLRSVNAPVYGFRSQIKSITHATSLLGNHKISAIVLQSILEESLAPIDLSAYNITKSIFYKVAKKRMDLMTYWFSKESISLLPTLSTSALLGNIGMIVIAKEAKRKRVQKAFSALVEDSYNPKVAESEFFNTIAEDVSADIMTHWGLDEALVDSIRYAYDIYNAPNDIKKLAIANYVVFTTVPSIDPRLRQDLAEEMGELLEEMGISKTPYKAAVAKVASEEI